MRRHLRLTLAMLLPAVFACGSDSVIGPNQGSLRVSVSTTGSSPDPDGYLVSLGNGLVPHPIGVNASVTIRDLTVGEYTVTLTGLASNCAATGSESKPVTVVGGATAESAFKVTCSPSAGTGSVDVSTETSGTALDPDGYLLRLDGGAGKPLGNNASVRLADLTPGDHTLELGGVASSCRVQGENPRGFTAVEGKTVAIVFHVQCTLPTAGQILVTSDRSGDYRLYSMSADGKAIIDLTPGTDGADGDWSPDGSKIVFSSTRDGDSEIYVMDADGSNPVRLTTTDALAEGPRWSPDGTRITFFYFGYPGSVVVMNADGSGLSVLSQGQQPSWSPDGTRIAFWREDPSACVLVDFCLANIYTMASDGSQVQKLTQNANFYGYPAWSPDGKTIAYTTAVFSSGVYVMNATGTGTRLIANLPNGGWSPVWSPDGAAIVFEAGQPAGTKEIRVVPAGGGPSETLASGPGTNRPTSWK